MSVVTAAVMASRMRFTTVGKISVAAPILNLVSVRRVEGLVIGHVQIGTRADGQYEGRR